MANTGLKGPYPLTNKEIDDKVTRTSAGAYALGRTDEEGAFLIKRIGRSDDDVNRRLHDHVGDYKKFKFGYYDSSKAAFEKECNLYHDFKPPDNPIHPARPSGTNWKCPRCNLFD